MSRAVILRPDAAVQPLARSMFVLTFTYLVPNVFYNILLQSYRAQNRMLLVNIMSFAETAVIGVFIMLTIGTFGPDAAWLSNTVVDVMCIIVVLISVVFYRRKLDFSLPALLKLPPGFGAGSDEEMHFSALSIEDVTLASEKAIAFCLDHGFSAKIANHVGVCVEEMAGNVLTHGFKSTKKKEYYADVRIVSKDGGLTVRIRDNCREFDPRKRMKSFDDEHPEKHIGMRISAKAARQVDYYNNAGINTLIMKF